jgi:transposase
MSVSIFKDALSSCKPGEILYASIDIAKYYHSAMVVNFFGDVIIPKFDFPYNNHGINFLRKKLQTAQKQTQARKLFLGVESTGHYHENLVASLRATGYHVQVIRSIDSKNERDNVHAKTDAIDLSVLCHIAA